MEDSQKAFGGPYSLTGILTRQGVIDIQPNLVRKVVNVHVRALKWIREHSEEEIANVLSSEIVGSDKERYIKTLKLLKDFYSPNEELSTEGAANVLAAMKLSGILTDETRIRPESFLVSRFVDSVRPTHMDAKPKEHGPRTASDSRLVYLVAGLLLLLVVVGLIVFLRRKQ